MPPYLRLVLCLSLARPGRQGLCEQQYRYSTVERAPPPLETPMAQTRFRGWPRRGAGAAEPPLPVEPHCHSVGTGVGATDPRGEREERVADALAAEGSPHLQRTGGPTAPQMRRLASPCRRPGQHRPQAHRTSTLRGRLRRERAPGEAGESSRGEMACFRPRGGLSPTMHAASSPHPTGAHPEGPPAAQQLPLNTPRGWDGRRWPSHAARPQETQLPLHLVDAGCQRPTPGTVHPIHPTAGMVWQTAEIPKAD